MSVRASVSGVSARRELIIHHNSIQSTFVYFLEKDCRALSFIHRGLYKEILIRKKSDG